MDPKELLHLTDRQLTDIIMQADNILEGRRDDEAIEEYVKYAREIGRFVRTHYSDDMILERVGNLPDIHYLRKHIEPVVYLLFPYYLYRLYTDYVERQHVLQQIRITRDIFSSIQFLNKSLMD